MRLCRFNQDRLGCVETDGIRDVTEALRVLPHSAYPYPNQDVLIGHLAEVRRCIAELPDDGRRLAPDSVSFLSPLANPGKLIAAPVNYQSHHDEAAQDQQTFNQAQIKRIQEVGLFLKANSSLIGPGQAIELRHLERRTDHEIELAAIIGKTARNVLAADALDYIAAYTIGLDITLRGPEERSLRKSIDTYSVLGPWMVTSDELPDPGNLDLLLTVDGEQRQRANTRDLLLSVPTLIEFASKYYTLLPGDVVFTGTPSGVGPILPGQQIEAGISGIGSMTVRVT